jgi:hypothetical protein
MVLSSLVVSWQRITVSLSFIDKVFFSLPNSFLTISSQSARTAIFRTRPDSRHLFQPLTTDSKFHSMLQNPSLQPLCTDHAENTAYIVKEMCIVIRWLAMNVILLRAFAPVGRCLPSRCLAVALCVMIFSVASYIWNDHTRTWLLPARWLNREEFPKSTLHQIL